MPVHDRRGMQPDRLAEHRAAALEDAHGEIALAGVEGEAQCGGRGFVGNARRTEQDGERLAALGREL